MWKLYSWPRTSPEVLFNSEEPCQSQKCYIVSLSFGLFFWSLYWCPGHNPFCQLLRGLHTQNWYLSFSGFFSIYLHHVQFSPLPFLDDTTLFFHFFNLFFPFSSTPQRIFQWRFLDSNYMLFLILSAETDHSFPCPCFLILSFSAVIFISVEISKKHVKNVQFHF